MLYTSYLLPNHIWAKFTLKNYDLLGLSMNDGDSWTLQYSLMSSYLTLAVLFCVLKNRLNLHLTVYLTLYIISYKQ